ncbi:hypothetical protein JYT74_02040 [Crocinitomix catalasitica]|nr:hypothetical protein [Crocinitomix catalasitica]
MKLIYIIITTLLICSSCKKFNRDKLDETIAESNLSNQTLLAMGAGAEFGYEGDSKHPIYIYFHHVGGATDYRFFETKDLSAASMDYSNYKEVKKAETSGLFNGFIFQLKLKEEHDRWGIMTYTIGDSLRISDPIKLQAIDRPTQSSVLWLEVDEDSITPVFSWQDSGWGESTDYFVLISDENGDAVCAGITNQKVWIFYDEAALDPNLISSPMPVLVGAKNYSFTVYGMSSDNWMNTNITKSFSTQ